MSSALPELIAAYLDLHWVMDPVEATAAGRHELDGTFGSWGRDARREYAAALRAITLGLEEAEAESLEQEIDRTAVLHSARHDILVLERERTIARDPSFHLGHLLTGLYLLLSRNGQEPARRAAALLDRLRAVPAFLERAAEALTDPVDVFVEAAQEMLPGGLALIRDGLADPEVDLSSLDPAELREASTAAEGALVAFSDALALMAENASSEFAIGRELFDRKLHDGHMIQDNADELYRFGERLRAEAKEKLATLAAEIEPGTEWRALAERLRTDRPRGAAMVREYAESMRAAREFVRSRALVTLTDAELEVLETPSFLRVLVPLAAYEPPGAYDAVQVGRFFVTAPLDDGAAPQCRAEVAGTALHEGVPGHHLQITTANALPSDVRRVLGTPATREGWALYCESLLAEQGYLDATQRFFQTVHLLWRAVRVLLDVSLHTRGMPVAEAVRMLRDEIGMDTAVAEVEVRRYCTQPTYQLCYAVGRRDILRLRDAAREAAGSAFSLAGFHDRLLSYGSLPTALARWGMGLG